MVQPCRKLRYWFLFFSRSVHALLCKLSARYTYLWMIFIIFLALRFRIFWIYCTALLGIIWFG
ncbi:hypothetical protein WL90_24960 [Burkholderia cenocepacia]|nr:hypothetical protein WL90_24960 [Burkholderia cenocepacia]KWF53268.1 hypothetical protein WL89_03740 [Burkholderia cenocepacia]